MPRQPLFGALVGAIAIVLVQVASTFTHDKPRTDPTPHAQPASMPVDVGQTALLGDLDPFAPVTLLPESVPAVVQIAPLSRTDGARGAEAHHIGRAATQAAATPGTRSSGP